jgi:hypothetical protein
VVTFQTEAASKMPARNMSVTSINAGQGDVTTDQNTNTPGSKSDGSQAVLNSENQKRIVWSQTLRIWMSPEAIKTFRERVMAKKPLEIEVYHTTIWRIKAKLI